MVLLKNENNLLPLSENQFANIALIGAHANNMVLGGYSGLPLERKTLFTSLQTKLAGKATIHLAKGFQIYTNYPYNSHGVLSGVIGIVPTAKELAQMRAEAVEIATKSELIILALGEDDMITHETWSDKIPGDHATLDLSPGQEALLDTLSTLGKPIIVYLINGRPMNLNQVQKKANAIIEGWYAGQEGSDVAVDLIFGKINPSGKLPVTFPASMGQLPLTYLRKPGSHRYDYIQMTSKPLYPFGYGLSYTTFAYTNFNLSADKLSIDKDLKASVTVTNTGKYNGTEIVQLYISDLVSSIERPIIELKDFARVELKVGESKTISFKIDKSKLEFWTINKRFEAEVGEFEVMVGASSSDIKAKATFKLL
jgi:beta-glucosidase